MFAGVVVAPTMPLWWQHTVWTTPQCVNPWLAKPSRDVGFSSKRHPAAYCRNRAYMRPRSESCMLWQQWLVQPAVGAAQPAAIAWVGSPSHSFVLDPRKNRAPLCGVAVVASRAPAALLLQGWSGRGGSHVPGRAQAGRAAASSYCRWGRSILWCFAGLRFC